MNAEQYGKLGWVYKKLEAEYGKLCNHARMIAQIKNCQELPELTKLSYIIEKTTAPSEAALGYSRGTFSALPITMTGEQRGRVAASLLATMLADAIEEYEKCQQTISELHQEAHTITGGHE